ncbi:winged helix-turn-helix domain-containing protein [Streptomyces nigra]|uniref:winged helix-turn-helix domain-containing protein n=1 Tax=Streptomyces nigra TaxID=1827580 RepID=UPI0036B1BFA9
MAERQPTLAKLPRKSPFGSYVYALNFNVGVVKVGLTSSPSKRIRTYLTTLLPFGISIADQWVSEPHGQAEDNEALLLEFCRARASTVMNREYFAGLAFSDVTAFAATLPYVAIRTGPSAPVPSETRYIRWRQIAAIIQNRIDDGTYPAGSRVPSVVDISTEFEVAASTAQKVLGHLKSEGLIRTEVGLGSFVEPKS